MFRQTLCALAAAIFAGGPAIAGKNREDGEPAVIPKLESDVAEVRRRVERVLREIERDAVTELGKRGARIGWSHVGWLCSVSFLQFRNNGQLIVHPGGQLKTGTEGLINNGILSIGKPAGEFRLDGNFEQTEEGRLEIEIGGAPQTADYDVLRVDDFDRGCGDADLDGFLDLSLFNGYAPTLSTEFSVLTTPSEGTLSGYFAYVDASGAKLPNGRAWELSYDQNDSDSNDLNEVILKVVASNGVDLEIESFYTDGSGNLNVRYYVYGSAVDEFDIGIFASPDGETPSLELQRYTVSDANKRTVGRHTVTFDPTFDDPEGDCQLTAAVDSTYQVPETDDTNNWMIFAGGSCRVRTIQKSWSSAPRAQTSMISPTRRSPLSITSASPSAPWSTTAGPSTWTTFTSGSAAVVTK